MKDRAIILFTRIPIPGQTKTRLQPFLSGDECCILQEAFINDIYTMIKSIGIDIFLCYTPLGDIDKLKTIITDDISFIPQRGDTLGEKMYNAISDVLNFGYDSCVLIGSDIPLIESEHIKKAFSLLLYSDMVISPTEDGGYYLIGMKEVCKDIFTIEYGNNSVMEETCNVMKNIGKSYRIGTSNFDIDEKEDLFKLMDILKNDKSNKCKQTKRALNIIFGDGEKYERFKLKTYSKI